ncbi:horsetail movement protein Hrs1/Mcp6 [Schizosaccharomyces cryophilus OY26]|uniref:Horsetail movement protein Hrs1/Mcp6 n=1 Tax=Schizosaccharomyces cryophilus (strain OY26 / ATCC MYA-4695 / CBS 11777 / NBRC 106824 / NRRL Y48691) TaxID=653667 RepID=S9VXZ5_SCHCR|nr:horsetail movement protein Hrs1/Mcp6 [Schizosaccharomyces cryophilus OY26]EPY51089.1 horsetail movement protein Hrs1/Mcp6 [Schizosaccharomyces cryophilus OY26]
MNYEDLLQASSSPDTTCVPSSPTFYAKDENLDTYHVQNVASNGDVDLSEKTIRFLKLQMNAKGIIDAFERDSLQNSLEIKNLKLQLEEERRINEQFKQASVMKLQDAIGQLKNENQLLLDQNEELLTAKKENETRHELLKQDLKTIEENYKASSMQIRNLVHENSSLKTLLYNHTREAKQGLHAEIEPSKDWKEQFKEKIKAKRSPGYQRNKYHDVNLCENSQRERKREREREHVESRDNNNQANTFSPRSAETRSRILRLQESFSDLETQHNSFRHICDSLREKLKTDSSKTKQRLLKLENLLQNRSPPSYTFSLSCTHQLPHGYTTEPFIKSKQESQNQAFTQISLPSDTSQGE